MARRIRSWISRSSPSAAPPPRARGTPRVAGWSGAPRGSARVALGSATVLPGDHEAERQVQAAEPDRHQRIPPLLRREQSDSADDHEAEPHERYDTHRIRAAGDDAGPVEQEPGPGKRPDAPRAG